MTIDAPAAKLATVWGTVAIGSLIDWLQVISYALGIVYTCILIAEWCWKKFLRGCFERQGWVKPRKRRTTDQDYT